MSFVAELLLEHTGESTLKANLTGAGEMLCVSNEGSFYHVKISSAAPSNEKRMDLTIEEIVRQTKQKTQNGHRRRLEV